MNNRRGLKGHRHRVGEHGVCSFRCTSPPSAVSAREPIYRRTKRQVPSKPGHLELKLNSIEWDAGASSPFRALK
jgi:hypothetical protein